MSIFSKKKEDDNKAVSEKSGKVAIAEKDNKEPEAKEIEKAKGTKKRKISGEKSIAAENVIIRPWVSEKASIMISKGVYSFKVSEKASKNLVKDLIESLYNVKVENVNILNNKGKLKNFKGKSGQRSDSKKAVVTLREGQKIEEIAI